MNSREIEVRLVGARLRHQSSQRITKNHPKSARIHEFNAEYFP